MITAGHRALLRDAAERAIAYLDDLENRPVAAAPEAVAALEAALDETLPESPSSDNEALAFLDKIGGPATVASAGPRYYGFVTGGALPATVAAQWLAGAWDQNGFGHVSSPAIGLFEERALDWCKSLLHLPSDCGGNLATGATMANFSGLAAARHAVLAKVGWDVEANGLFGAPEITLLAGAEGHSSLIKVLGLLGLGRKRIFSLPVDDQGRIRADRLPDAKEIAQRGPAILCLQAGNVNSGAFDPFEPLIDWAQEAGAWVHIDGAFGLWAATVPSFADLTRGYHRADSWALDCHKWLNVPYDCGLTLVRDAASLGAAMSISGAYLMPSGRRDAIDYTPESSRRARAIEVWTALKTLGRQGFADLVTRNCAQAKTLATGLQAAGIEILNEVVLNQVVVAFGDEERTQRMIAAIQASGELWAGSTHWQGRPAMRVSFSNWATGEAEVERALAAIIKANQAN